METKWQSFTLEAADANVPDGVVVVARKKNSRKAVKLFRSLWGEQEILNNLINFVTQQNPTFDSKTN